MSALTNVITGHFARIVDTFKENEATADRIVRGRQILFMLHDHFSTNIKHGATYALEDLFSVSLRNDNLRVFMSSWDQVLAGITKVPGNDVLETLFYKQVKNSKSIAHDLNEYHRAEEGSEKHSYDFLLGAVRRHLDRERLESNRDRVARNLAGSQRASTPAVGAEKKTYIPKGYCIKWNRGGCSDDNCKFKHEVPPPKPTRKGRDSSREPSRGRSPSGRGDKSRACKFWKQGRCNRGNDCKFKHEGKPGKPRRATPARSTSQDSKGSDRNRRKKSRSTSRSKSPKSPKSPKGSPRSKAAAAPKAKASPAAVCLIASLLATMSQASPVVCCPAITFNKNVVSYEVEAEGDLWPIGKKPRTRKPTYPVDHKFTFDPSAAEDAALQAKMLAGAVERELKGVKVECKYFCDTEFGCDCCIPKNLVAMPAERRDLVEGSIQLPNVSWIADTGSAQDLITDSEFPDDYGYISNDPVKI